MKAGEQAEQHAADFLQHRGLRLLARNFRCRGGEVDLIMQEGDTLVFVEVRLRSNAQFGDAAASIDARKQARLLLTAQYYLATLPRTPPCRFDAVLIDGKGGMEWLKHAFTA